jgi:uncharacterized membrane protein YccC
MMPSGSPLRRALSRQLPALAVALRGTAAALTALAAAELLGLACPYWAAMTALIVIQPTRGLLLEKSFYRLLGTAAGSSAGLLLLLYTRSPLALTLAICFWVAACVGLGNLLYGLRSYASMMAGCTCVVIAMSGYQNQQHVYDIAFGRVACIIVGVIFATLVTALFTPRQPRGELLGRLDLVAAQSVCWLALLLRRGRGGDTLRMEQQILIEIAQLETELDSVGAGSLRFKKQARRIRGLLGSLLSLLAVGRLAGEQLARHDERRRSHGEWRDLLAGQLEELAGSNLKFQAGSLEARGGNLQERAGGWGAAGGSPESPGPGVSASEMAALAARVKAQLPLLGETLSDIVTSLAEVLAQCDSLTGSPEKKPAGRFVRHRDWHEACRAALRAALALGCIGVTWSLTGWVQGPLMLMAMSMMISIFSTKEHPAAFIANVFIGAAVGSVAAVFCRAVLLQGVTSALLTSAIVAPFLLLGVYAMTQPRTASAATDATLFFIFTTQPGMPVAIVPYDLALGALSMIMGVGSAWVSYRYLVPINPARRLRSLLNAILGDLELLASGASPRASSTLQARMQHRVIRLVVLAKGHNPEYPVLVEAALAALALARSIEILKKNLQIGELSGASCAIMRETLRSLSDLRRRPGNAPQLLESAANTLYEVLGKGAAAAATAPGHVSCAEAGGSAAGMRAGFSP